MERLVCETPHGMPCYRGRRRCRSRIRGGERKRPPGTKDVRGGAAGVVNGGRALPRPVFESGTDRVRPLHKLLKSNTSPRTLQSGLRGKQKNSQLSAGFRPQAGKITAVKMHGLSVSDEIDAVHCLRLPVPSPPGIRRIPAEREEIPAIVQFSAEPERSQRREFLNWSK